MKKARPLTKDEVSRIKQMLLLVNIKTVEPATVRGAGTLLKEIDMLGKRLDEQIENKEKQDAKGK